MMARSTGLKSDLRLLYSKTYSNYYNLVFRSFTGILGDSYDRYLLRMREMAESVNIITQVVAKLTTVFNKKKNSNKLSINSSFFFSFLDNINSYSLNLFKKSSQLN